MLSFTTTLSQQTDTVIPTARHYLAGVQDNIWLCFRAAMKCWICGDEASTGEHRTKKSDMRAIFGHVRQTQPVYWNSASQRNQRVKGLDARVLKFNDVLCSLCNNERTQPYDHAWEVLSTHLRSKPKIRGGDWLDLGRIFPGVVHRSVLRVHLFFVKLFGCLIVENSIPLDVGSYLEPF